MNPGNGSSIFLYKSMFTLGSGILIGAILVDGCVQVSIDAFIDEMNGEKILAQNEN